MTARKAQISWFVVAGLVIAIIILLMSWLTYSMGFITKKPQEAVTSESELGKVHAYLESCEKGLAEDALILIGNHGGMTEPKKYLTIETNKVSSEALPTLEEIGQDAANYIDKRLERTCRPETATKKEVQTSRPKTSVTFNDKETRVETEWQVTLKAANSTEQSISMIRFSLPVRMKLLHETAMKDLGIQGTDLTSVESLDNIGVKKIIYENSIINLLVDHKSEIKDKPYKFFYAEKV